MRLDGVFDVDGSNVLASCSDDDVLLAASDVKEPLKLYDHRHINVH